MADKVITIQTPRAAQIGWTPDGAQKLQGEALARIGHDSTDLGGAVGYANGQAATGGPGALQNKQAANNQASGANGNQAGAIELARRQAMGQAPGAGVQQLQQGLQQASAQQSAYAAGARGSAALATAGSNAAANRSNLQQGAFGNAGMMRAQDMATGRGMYASLTGQQRAQDGMALGAGNDFSSANQGAQDGYQLGMGGAAAGLGGVANAQTGANFTNAQNAFGIGYAQDDANQDQQTWQANNRKAAIAANEEDMPGKTI